MEETFVHLKRGHYVQQFPLNTESCELALHLALPALVSRPFVRPHSGSAGHSFLGAQGHLAHPDQD